MFEENQKLIDDAKELETLRADKASLIAELQAIRQERENEINDDALVTECKEIAQSALDEVMRCNEGDAPDDLREEFNTHIEETIDGHDWLIHPSKTHKLCANCDVSDGEAFLADVGAGESPDYDKLAVTIAYGEMKARAMSALDDLIEEWNEAHENDEEDDEDEDDEESDEESDEEEGGGNDPGEDFRRFCEQATDAQLREIVKKEESATRTHEAAIARAVARGRGLDL